MKFLRKFRYFKSKKALFVLSWTFVFFLAPSLSLRDIATPKSTVVEYSRQTFFGSLLFYFLPPIAADLWFGRQTVMMIGTLLTWIGLLFLSIGTALSGEHEHMEWLPDWFETFLQLFWLMVMNIGRALFQSNVIQFGVDQLGDPSSEEIISFIHWFIFSEFLGSFAAFLLSYFVSLTWSSLVVTTVLSLFLCVLYLWSGTWLIKEQSKRNKYRITYKVIAYSLKQKQHARRAFVHWDERMPSRIDMAKCSNGGPFTHDQVEDVKVFLKLVLLMIVLVGVVVAFESNFTVFESYRMFLHLGLPIDSAVTQMSVNRQLISLIAMVYVLLHELVIIPLFRRFINFSIMKKLWISYFLRVVNLLSILAIDATGHRLTNNNTTCMFDLTATVEDSLDPNPYIALIPGILNAIAYTMLYMSVVEFAFAQCPVGLNGLIFGVSFSIVGLGLVVSYLLSLPFSKVYPRETSASEFSCGSAYFLIFSVVGVISLVVFTVVAVKYKYRERLEVQAAHEQYNLH